MGAGRDGEVLGSEAQGGTGPPHLQQSRARQGWKPLLEPCRRSW